MQNESIYVLLADDDKDDRDFFIEAFESIRIKTIVKTVNDGVELMKHLALNRNKLPHILFLDLNMPRKNGFECLEEIKHNRKLKALPVVVFSTSFEQEVVNRLYDNGAQYFIRKPSEFSLYKKIILHTLTLIMQKDISQMTKEDFVLTVENSLVP